MIRNEIPLSINSTVKGFDCSELDVVAYDRPKPLDSGRYYTCSAYINGRDTAKHQKRPAKKMARGVLAAIIIGSIAIALLVIVLFIQFRKSQQTRQPAETGAALSDLPPQYARRPKPHEVPPGYIAGGESEVLVGDVTRPVEPVANDPVEQETISNASASQHPAPEAQRS